MPTLRLDAGTIHYEETGPADGPTLLFIHGYAMGPSLWRPLMTRLAASGIRCIAPTWPLGAHPEPMAPGADVTMHGVAAMVCEFIDRLELTEPVLVGSDTGGALAQLVAVGWPDRLGALVLTGCDAFEHFPPPILKPLIAASRGPRLFRTAVKPIGTRFGRRRAYGALAHANLEALTAEWATAALSDARITEDLRRFTASMQGSVTVEVAQRLPSFSKPALIAWSADDVFFPLEDGRRLAATIPDARFALIERARTFSMIDQPDVLADLIERFVTVDAGYTPSSSTATPPVQPSTGTR